MKLNQIEKALLFEVLSSEIDEELENDILEFINREIAVEVEDLLFILKVSLWKMYWNGLRNMKQSGVQEVRYIKLLLMN